MRLVRRLGHSGRQLTRGWEGEGEESGLWSFPRLLTFLFCCRWADVRLRHSQPHLVPPQLLVGAGGCVAPRFRLHGAAAGRPSWRRPWPRHDPPRLDDRCVVCICSSLIISLRVGFRVWPWVWDGPRRESEWLPDVFSFKCLEPFGSSFAEEVSEVLVNGRVLGD